MRRRWCSSSAFALIALPVLPRCREAFLERLARAGNHVLMVVPPALGVSKQTQDTDPLELCRDPLPRDYRDAVVAASRIIGVTVSAALVTGEQQGDSARVERVVENAVAQPVSREAAMRGEHEHTACGEP